MRPSIAGNVRWDSYLSPRALRSLFFCAVKFIFFLAFERAQQWEENHVAYRAGISQQHRQAIDADAFTGGWRQSVRQGANVVVVHLVSFFVAARPFAPLLFETMPLLLGIVQLAEGITDLQTADKNFEALHPVGILLGLALVFRQRRD